MSPECLSTADPVSHITVELQPHHERGLVRENDTMRWNEKREREIERTLFFRNCLLVCSFFLQGFTIQRSRHGALVISQVHPQVSGLCDHRH